jgi:hypothetical protein
MSLLAIAISIAAIFAIIVAFLIMYMRRVTDMALTEQFRAAESIVSGHIPDQWIAQINRRIAIRRATRLFHHEVNGIELVLDKINNLYRFFENSPFIENEKTRQLLLEQLRETRERWAKMTWEGLVSENTVDKKQPH